MPFKSIPSGLNSTVLKKTDFIEGYEGIVDNLANTKFDPVTSNSPASSVAAGVPALAIETVNEKKDERKAISNVQGRTNQEPNKTLLLPPPPRVVEQAAYLDRSKLRRTSDKLLNPQQNIINGNAGLPIERPNASTLSNNMHNSESSPIMKRQKRAIERVRSDQPTVLMAIDVGPPLSSTMRGKSLIHTDENENQIKASRVHTTNRECEGLRSRPLSSPEHLPENLPIQSTRNALHLAKRSKIHRRKSSCLCC